jgi:hypothetical protein
VKQEGSDIVGLPDVSVAAAGVGSTVCGVTVDTGRSVMHEFKTISKILAGVKI